MAEIAVSAAVAFLKLIPGSSGKPFQIPFSTKSSTTDIAADSLKFADQVVDQTNLDKGTDTDTKTLNVDEFARLASGDKVKKLSQITDSAQKALVEETFYDISKNKALATASDFAEYLRVRDARDGKTDGQATINFLI